MTDLSVIIAAKDAEATLAGQLDALLAQRWDGGWQVLVVDNGSTDRTPDIVRDYAGRFPNVRLLIAPGGNEYRARNAGIAATTSPTLAFCDSDDVVADGWLPAMASALAGHGYVGGALEVDRLNESSSISSRPGVGGKGPSLFGGVAPFAHGCNVGVRREIFDRYGRFLEGFYAGDIELGVRLWTAGVRMHYEPEAVVHYRLRSRVRDSWVQARRAGNCHPVLAKQLRDHGATVPAGVAGARNWLWLIRHAPSLRSRPGRARWCRVAGTAVGRLEGSIAHRSLFL